MTDEEAAAQCALIRVPQTRTMKLMDWLVKEHGTDSEKHGVKFGLWPVWAAERAKELLVQFEIIDRMRKDDGLAAF